MVDRYGSILAPLVGQHGKSCDLKSCRARWLRSISARSSRLQWQGRGRPCTMRQFFVARAGASTERCSPVQSRRRAWNSKRSEPVYRQDGAQARMERHHMHFIVKGAVIACITLVSAACSTMPMNAGSGSTPARAFGSTGGMPMEAPSPSAGGAGTSTGTAGGDVRLDSGPSIGGK